MERKSMFRLITLGLALFLLVALPAARIRAATCTSTGDGNWSATETWTNCADTIPQSEDAVIIAVGHTVTVDTTTIDVSSLTVDGTLTFDATGIVRTMTVAEDVVVNSSGTLNGATSGTATTHSLVIGGNLTVDGIFTAVASRGKIDVTFNKADDQSVSGNGSLTFNKIVLSKGSVSNKVIASASLSVGSGADDFDPDNGTWEQNGGVLSRGGTANIEVGASGGLIFSGSGGLSCNGGLINGGTLTVNTSGSLSLGNGNDRLETSAGGITTLTAGIVNVNGKFTLASDSTTTINGATIHLDPQDSSTLGSSNDVFEAVSSANLDMSSGSITIVDPLSSSGSGRDIQIVSGTGTKSFSGGVINIGDGTSATAGSADGFKINSGVPLFNLVIKNQAGGTDRFVQLDTNSLSLNGSLTIDSGGELRANALDISLQGNWSNSGLFTPGSGTVTFNDGATSTYEGSTTTTFNNVIVGVGATLDVGSNTIFKADGVVTNNGVMQQTATVDNSSFHFANVKSTANADAYLGVAFSTSDNLGSTKVKLYGNQNSSGAAGTPVNRWYQIDPANSGTVNLTFYFLCSELQSGQTPATLKVWRFNGSTWDNLGNSANSGETCSGNGFVTVNDVNLGMEERNYVLKVNDPLAVTLEQVETRIEENGIVIEWQTVSELDYLGFHIQRREDHEPAWTQRTETLIPSPSPGAPDGQSYRWVDTAIADNAFYHYRIDGVDLQGNPHPLHELTIVLGEPFHQWLPAILAP